MRISKIKDLKKKLSFEKSIILQYNEKMSRLTVYDISNKARKYLEDQSTEGIIKFLNNFKLDK
jgi:hypothetical protein